MSRTAPNVSTTEEELRIRSQPRMPPVKAWAEHIGQQPVVDALPRVGLATEVRNQPHRLVQLVLEVARVAVSCPLVIVVSGIHVQPGLIQADFELRRGYLLRTGGAAECQKSRKNGCARQKRLFTEHDVLHSPVESNALPFLLKSSDLLALLKQRRS